MSLTFVHLSDIHFGQEKGGQLVVNDDVKEQLIIDVRDVLLNLPARKADGIIISGDITYAGQKIEYVNAGQWIDRLTGAAGCSQTAVQVVPGNHDIDRSLITPGAQKLIDDIIANGDEGLDKYLAYEQDRELLYQRFMEYRTFAQAYNSPIDGEGTILGHRVFEISPNKYLKFHGINTALICSRNDEEEGKLLLGKRQRVIPIKDCTEIIIIAHHPLNWLQDSEDALRYIKNRARVFISGHEHMPSHKLENVDKNVSILSIASGATVPPNVNENFNYCYNVIEFNYDNDQNALIITIYPRNWIDEKKTFEEDSKHFKNYPCTFTLNCPHYKRELSVTNKDKLEDSEQIKSSNDELLMTDIQEGKRMSERLNQQLLFDFFRKLSSTQRIEILVKMGVLPESLATSITHNTETIALKNIFSKGRAEELQSLINDFLSPNLEKRTDD